MAPRKRGCLRIVLLLVLALLLLAAVLIGWGWQAQKAFAGQVLQPRAESVIIEPGDSFSRVLAKLRAAGIDNGRDQQWQLLAIIRRFINAPSQSPAQLGVGHRLLQAGCCRSTSASCHVQSATAEISSVSTARDRSTT